MRLPKASDIIKKFLQIWANFVILETNNVCDKLHTLAVDKEKIKETLFRKEAERQKHYESNSYEIQFFSEMTRSKDQYQAAYGGR